MHFFIFCSVYMFRLGEVDEAYNSEHSATMATNLKGSIHLFDDSDYGLPQHLQRYDVVTDVSKVCFEVWCQKKLNQQSNFSISSKSEDLMTRRSFDARKFRTTAVYKMKL